MNPLRAVFIVLAFLMVWGFLSILSRKDIDRLSPSGITKLADSTIRVITSSFHDSGYENAWIQSVDKKKEVARIQTAESKIVITFRPKKEALDKYRKGWIAPVTILCPDNSNDCDFDSLKKLYVSNEEVKLLEREFLGKARKLKFKLNKKPS